MRRALPALGLLLAGALAWLLWPVQLPPAPAGTRVLDRAGHVLAERPAPAQAPGGALAAPPPVLARAVLAAEDHRFEQHPGVDPIAVARAAWANVQAGAVVQGGSTLTQQLVRLAWPRPPGLRGKLWEAALALRLEAQLPKDRILAEYLNRVYLGNLCTGAECAAQALFDKPAAALSVAEAALLAALPRRPGQLDPWAAPAAARAARDRVLRRMHSLGWLDAAGLERALEQPLGLRRGAPWDFAPHLVRRLRPSGGDIPTTLDIRLQAQAEALVAQTVARLAPQGVGQAAALVVDRRTAEVLAYVGSAGWALPQGQVDGVMAPRSPGSALKPFVVWLGLERGSGDGGITLATVLADLPGSWTTTHGAWNPGNYDGRYAGPVTAREALARSLNLPMVRVLERVGVASLLRRLYDLGLSTLPERPEHYGLGLALGDGEVRLDELAAAYTTLGNLGRARPLRFRRDDPPAGERQVGDPQAAALVLDALDDPIARAPSFGLDSALEPAFPLAAKTGTSVGWRDNWAIGVSPDVVVVVWVGNFTGEPMREVSGITGAAPLMRALAEAAQRGGGALPTGRGLVERRICPLSGALASERCPASRVERFLPGTPPREPCAWHVQVDLHPDGALGTGCPGTRPQTVVAWPPEYTAWAAQEGLAGWPAQDRSCTSAPVQGSAGTLGVLSPPDGAVYFLDHDRPAQDQGVPLRVAAPRGAQRCAWAVDGTPLGSGGPPYTARWVPSPGEHTVEVSCDGALVGRSRVSVGASGR